MTARATPDYTTPTTLASINACQNDLPKSFNPQKTEFSCYDFWLATGCFSAGCHVQTGLGEPFVIQFPPPNVTGTLHMGHAFNHTIMDTLVRWRRMSGDDTVFIPGTDHAGIATQIVVEHQLDAQGVSRQDLGRVAFIEKVWGWKKTSGSTIMSQVRRLGASADWPREYFTMDDRMSVGVREAFVRLYEQGLIYRGKRLVNWDPVLLTAVSDLEVLNEETDGHIWHILYPFVDGPQAIINTEGLTEISRGLTIATTRPETILADSALCVHPEDHRYIHLLGRLVELPLCQRNIPIIADDFVDPAFGTGCVKITGAHDFNDYACAQRHDLPLLEIFTLDAKINSNGPPQFQGMDRYEARRAVLAKLDAEGYLVSVQPHKMMQPRGDRSGVALEPMLTDQWFLAMSEPAPVGTLHPGKSITQVALEVVADGRVKFFPESWTATYNQWLENIQDWCISRQIWWGHQIPAWYAEDGRVFVARDANTAIAQARAAGVAGPLRRDSDVLDTWFSSALVPFTSLGWPEQTPDLVRYLPSSVLVTGFDIIFFWVARMIMMSTHLTGRIPFKHIYVHGLVRDSSGKKMSKSKGNTLDPVDLIDGINLEGLVAKRTFGLMNPKQANAIEKATRIDFPNGVPSFGTDALRFTMAAYATPGRNINFELKRCEGYRNFCNKLWNAARYVLINTRGEPLVSAPTELSFADRWILSALQELKREVAKWLVAYRFDNVANALYRFIWEEYCDWYVELAKVQIIGGTPTVQIGTRQTLIHVLEETLRLAHPIIPFITEALWQPVGIAAGKRAKDEQASISKQPYPVADDTWDNTSASIEINALKAQIEAIRALRSAMSLSPTLRVPLVAAGEPHQLRRNAPYLAALAKLAEVEVVDKLPKVGAPVQVAGAVQLMLRVGINIATEQARLDKEIGHLEDHIRRCSIKLANPRFVARARTIVVEKEHQRIAQFQETLDKVLEQRRKLTD